MIKVALVFGTRPEAIKLAPVYLELKKRKTVFQPLLWLTGQHRQMLDQVMRVFDLHADRDFDLMKPGQTLTSLTHAVLEATTSAFAEERPDCILVQGDTTTVFAASLAAYYAKIHVGHVEAGLRTPTKYSPFPEEMNRRLTTRLADLHFPPTQLARENLLREGVSEDCIWVTGNTVIDALAIVSERVRRERPPLPAGLPPRIIDGDGRMVLITGHRRESFGEGFETICQAIAVLGRRYPDCEFVYPVHLNPNVQEPVHRLLSHYPNIHLIKPVEYEPFVWLMNRSHLLLTDSGGIQEEAPHLGKPVLVMRETTERPEGLDAGTAKLVGVNLDQIVNETARLLDDPAAYQAMSQAANPFGDGKSAQRIADILERQFRPGSRLHDPEC